MDEDQLNDLKQFIAGTVSQATTGLATTDALNKVAKDVAELKKDVAELKTKTNDLDLKVDTISEALNESLNDHETRLIKLEQQAA